MAQSVRADMGDGPSHWNEQVELKGKVVCEHPLQGQFTERPAVVVKTKIVREYEEYKKAETAKVKLPAAGSNDPIHCTMTHAIPASKLTMALAVFVSPSGAEYTLESVVNRFEPPGAMDRGSSASVSIGGFTLSLGNMTFGNFTGRTLIGVQDQRKFFAGRRRYTRFGREVRDGTDGLTLNDPSDKCGCKRETLLALCEK